MAEIVPTRGRIVWYVLAEHDVAAIQRSRPSSHSSHGNAVHVGDIFPAMVVQTWGDRPDSAVNLKVELDGPDTLWVTSRHVGEGPGTYHWMPYQVGQAKKNA